MTDINKKREEIREGIERILSILYNFHLDGAAYADQILKELHHLGVVIKADREPDEFKREDGDAKYYGDMPSEMYDDGWRLVEPLIGE